MSQSESQSGVRKKLKRRRSPTSVGLRDETLDRLDNYVRRVGGNRSEAIESLVNRALDDWEVANARRELPKIVAELKLLADLLRQSLGE